MQITAAFTDETAPSTLQEGRRAGQVLRLRPRPERLEIGSIARVIGQGEDLIQVLQRRLQHLVGMAVRYAG